MKYQIHFDNGEVLVWETILTEEEIKCLMVRANIVITPVGIIAFGKVCFITKLNENEKQIRTPMPVTWK